MCVWEERRETEKRDRRGRSPSRETRQQCPADSIYYIVPDKSALFEAGKKSAPRPETTLPSPEVGGAKASCDICLRYRGAPGTEPAAPGCLSSATF